MRKINLFFLVLFLYSFCYAESLSLTKSIRLLGRHCSETSTPGTVLQVRMERLGVEM